MKITKYLIALGGLCAIIIWATSSGCSSKQVVCNNDSTFATASAVLAGECNRCHGDSLTSSKYGAGVVFNSLDSNQVLALTYNPTYNGFFGIIVADIETTSGKHQMPLKGPNLSGCEIAAVKNWIWFHYTH